jgi:glycine/D-amino acid oxidase-like deaminating enzyme
MQSFYEATVVRPERASLSGKRAADVCIIGGGLAGLSTALGLVERGVREVVVLEAQQVGFGASGRNGGFVFGGLLEPDAFHFHPLKYARGLAAAIERAGGRIHEQSRVSYRRAALARRRPRGAHGRGVVHARHVVVAGGGYLRGVSPRSNARCCRSPPT